MPKKLTIIVCMKGKIKSKQRCIGCGADTSYVDNGSALICTTCGKSPSSFYVDVYFSKRENGGSAERRKFYSHPATGDPFITYEQCSQFLQHLRYEMTQGLFEAQNYCPKHLEVRRFTNYAETFITRFKTLVPGHYRSQSTLVNYEGSLRNYLIPFFGEMDIAQVKTHHVMAFYHEILNVLNLKEHTKKNHMSLLARVLRCAWEEFDIQAKFPTFPKIDVPEDNDWKLIDAQTQDLIISTIRNFSIRTAILFCARQWARPGETRALKVRDIDFVTHSVWIRGTFSKRGQLKPTTKTRRKRALPLDPEVEQHLERLCEGKTPNGFVFSTDDGGYLPFGESTFRETWRRACKRLGIEDVVLYPGTRHSSATQAINRGVDSKIVKDMLGHTTFKMTDRYAKVSTERLRAALRPDVENRRTDISGRVLDV